MHDDEQRCGRKRLGSLGRRVGKEAGELTLRQWGGGITLRLKRARRQRGYMCVWTKKPPVTARGKREEGNGRC